MEVQEQLKQAGVAHIDIQAQAAKDDGDWDLPGAPQTDVKLCSLEGDCEACQ